MHYEALVDSNGYLKDGGELGELREKILANIARDLLEQKVNVPAPIRVMRISKAWRLVFQRYIYDGKPYLLVLKHFKDHDEYERFLSNAQQYLKKDDFVVSKEDCIPMSDHQSDVVDEISVKPCMLYGNQVISLSSQQLEDLEGAYDSVEGFAGTGKTVNAFMQLSIWYEERKNRLKSDPTLALPPIVYLGPDNLILSLSEKLEERYGETDGVLFMTPDLYAKFILKNNNPDDETTLVGIAAFEEWYRTKEISKEEQTVVSKKGNKAKKKPQNFISSEVVYREFKLIKAKGSERYLSDGDRVNRLLASDRKKILELFEKYQLKLKESQELDVYLCDIPSAEGYVDRSITDEAQMAPMPVFASLARVPHKLYQDANQITTQRETPLDFIQLDKRKCFYLDNGSYRVPKAIAALIMAVAFKPKFLLSGRGTCAKGQHFHFTSNLDRQGEVFWCEHYDKDRGTTKRIIQSYCDARNLAQTAFIIFYEEDRVAVEKRFPGSQIYKAAEAAGLEFDTVILWNPPFAKIGKENFRADTHIPSESEIHGAKDSTYALENEEKILLCNEIFLAISRVKKRTFIVNNQEGNIGIIRHVQSIAMKISEQADASASVASNLETTYESKKQEILPEEVQGQQQAAALKQITALIVNGKLEVAETIYKQYPFIGEVPAFQDLVREITIKKLALAAKAGAAIKQMRSPHSHMVEISSHQDAIITAVKSNDKNMLLSALTALDKLKNKKNTKLTCETLFGMLFANQFFCECLADIKNEISTQILVYFRSTRMLEKFFRSQMIMKIKHEDKEKRPLLTVFRSRKFNVNDENALMGEASFARYEQFCSEDQHNLRANQAAGLLWLYYAAKQKNKKAVKCYALKLKENPFLRENTVLIENNFLKEVCLNPDAKKQLELKQNESSKRVLGMLGMFRRDQNESLQKNLCLYLVKEHVEKIFLAPSPGLEYAYEFSGSPNFFAYVLRNNALLENFIVACKLQREKNKTEYYRLQEKFLSCHEFLLQLCYASDESIKSLIYQVFYDVDDLFVKNLIECLPKATFELMKSDNINYSKLLLIIRLFGGVYKEQHFYGKLYDKFKGYFKDKFNVQVESLNFNILVPVGLASIYLGERPRKLDILEEIFKDFVRASKHSAVTHSLAMLAWLYKLQSLNYEENKICYDMQRVESIAPNHSEIFLKYIHEAGRCMSEIEKTDPKHASLLKFLLPIIKKTITEKVFDLKLNENYKDKLKELAEAVTESNLADNSDELLLTLAINAETPLTSKILIVVHERLEESFLKEMILSQIRMHAIAYADESALVYLAQLNSSSSYKAPAEIPSYEAPSFSSQEDRFLIGVQKFLAMFDQEESNEDQRKESREFLKYSLSPQYVKKYLQHYTVLEKNHIYSCSKNFLDCILKYEALTAVFFAIFNKLEKSEYRNVQEVLFLEDAFWVTVLNAEPGLMKKFIKEFCSDVSVLLPKFPYIISRQRAAKFVSIERLAMLTQILADMDKEKDFYNKFIQAANSFSRQHKEVDFASTQMLASLADIYINGHAGSIEIPQRVFSFLSEIPTNNNCIYVQLEMILCFYILRTRLLALSLLNPNFHKYLALCEKTVFNIRKLLPTTLGKYRGIFDALFNALAADDSSFSKMSNQFERIRLELFNSVRDEDVATIPSEGLYILAVHHKHPLSSKMLIVIRQRFSPGSYEALIFSSHIFMHALTQNDSAAMAFYNESENYMLEHSSPFSLIRHYDEFKNDVYLKKYIKACFHKGDAFIRALFAYNQEIKDHFGFNSFFDTNCSKTGMAKPFFEAFTEYKREVGRGNYIDVLKYLVAFPDLYDTSLPIKRDFIIAIFLKDTYLTIEDIFYFLYKYLKNLVENVIAENIIEYVVRFLDFLELFRVEGSELTGEELYFHTWEQVALYIPEIPPDEARPRDKLIACFMLVINVICNAFPVQRPELQREILKKQVTLFSFLARCEPENLTFNLEVVLGVFRYFTSEGEGDACPPCFKGGIIKESCERVENFLESQEDLNESCCQLARMVRLNVEDYIECRVGFNEGAFKLSNTIYLNNRSEILSHGLKGNIDTVFWQFLARMCLDSESTNLYDKIFATDPHNIVYASLVKAKLFIANLKTQPAQVSVYSAGGAPGGPAFFAPPVDFLSQTTVPYRSEYNSR